MTVTPVSLNDVLQTELRAPRKTQFSAASALGTELVSPKRG